MYCDAHIHLRLVAITYTGYTYVDESARVDPRECYIHGTREPIRAAHAVRLQVLMIRCARTLKRARPAKVQKGKTRAYIHLKVQLYIYRIYAGASRVLARIAALPRSASRRKLNDVEVGCSGFAKAPRVYPASYESPPHDDLQVCDQRLTEKAQLRLRRTIGRANYPRDDTIAARRSESKTSRDSKYQIRQYVCVHRTNHDSEQMCLCIYVAMKKKQWPVACAMPSFIHVRRIILRVPECADKLIFDAKVLYVYCSANKATCATHRIHALDIFTCTGQKPQPYYNYTPGPLLSSRWRGCLQQQQQQQQQQQSTAHTAGRKRSTVCAARSAAHTYARTPIGTVNAMQAYYDHTRALLLLLPVLLPILNFIDLNALHVHAAYGIISKLIERAHYSRVLFFRATSFQPGSHRLKRTKDNGGNFSSPWTIVHDAYMHAHIMRTRGEQKISLQKLARYINLSSFSCGVSCAARGGLGTARHEHERYSRALIQADNLRTHAYK
ncbi:unnamed protein product [Trichogramma brassicae]|uniref:Uncharacterized protein n=1 Tax=Trichogramma brassicae TaxID=86971 RepID=A0A6H5J7B3_9HYME|nr:unnamed protein product [Trichogramma brassicae]